MEFLERELGVALLQHGFAFRLKHCWKKLKLAQWGRLLAQAKLEIRQVGVEENCTTRWPPPRIGPRVAGKRWSWGGAIPQLCIQCKTPRVDTAAFFPYRADVETREKILETAVKLFSSHGYADTSLAQVARAAHVSKALVLWYFESKEQLFRAALQHFLAPYEIDDHVLDGLDERQQVEKLIDDYYDFIAEHLYSVRFVLGQVVGGDENSQELVTRARELHVIYRGLLTTILERGQEKKLFGLTVRPAEDAALIMAALNGLLVQRLVEQMENGKAQELLARLKQMMRAQLCQSLSMEGQAAEAETCPVEHSSLLRTGS